MSQAREYTLAEIAVELGLPFETVQIARDLISIYPTRRDAAGMAFYNRRAVCLFHRLLIEKDGTALLEPAEPGAWQRYLESQLGVKITTVPLTAEDVAFADLVERDVAAAEKLLDELYPQ